MLVMGKGADFRVMGCIVPANLQLVLPVEPIVAVSPELVATPLFGNPQIRSILEIQDQAQGLAIKFKHNRRLICPAKVFSISRSRSVANIAGSLGRKALGGDFL